MTDIEQLHLFVARAEELRTVRLMQSGLNPTLSISHNQKDGTSRRLNEPDEEELRSFLLTYRQFISPKEPVFINRIYNICLKYVTVTERLNNLVDAKKKWKELQRNNNLRLIYKGQEISPAEVQNLWINGCYFHNDQDKKEKLEKLSNGAQAIFRYQFLAFVNQATTHILYIADQLKTAFKLGEIKDEDNC